MLFFRAFIAASQGVNMPIYEYRCASCGFEKEYLQKLSDVPITGCESCGQPTMTKLISAAGFQLKGSGWYVTDFKNNGAKSEKAAQKGKEDASPGATASDATGDTKAKPSSEDKSTVDSAKAAVPASQPVP
jgi:putative FmdB family regulatory protein